MFKSLANSSHVHDAMCDYEAEIHGVAGGWPHYFYKEDKAQGAAWKEQ